MSNMKNFMMDVEEFCDGYSYEGMSGLFFKDFTVNEVIEDVEMYFKSSEAVKYAKQYLIQKIGE